MFGPAEALDNQTERSEEVLEQLVLQGDFGASLALSGPQNGGSAGDTLGLATIDGTLTGGLWYVVGNAGTTSAGQVASGWTGDVTGTASFDTIGGGISLISFARRPASIFWCEVLRIRRRTAFKRWKVSSKPIGLTRRLR